MTRRKTGNTLFRPVLATTLLFKKSVTAYFNNGNGQTLNNCAGSHQGGILYLLGSHYITTSIYDVQYFDYKNTKPTKYKIKDEIQRKIRVAAARRRIAASTGSGDGERNGFEGKKEPTVPAAARRRIVVASVNEEKYSATKRIRGGGDDDDDDARAEQENTTSDGDDDDSRGDQENTTSDRRTATAVAVAAARVGHRGNRNNTTKEKLEPWENSEAKEYLTKHQQEPGPEAGVIVDERY